MVPKEYHANLARRLVRLMDVRFSLYGLKFGIDPFTNIIPGFGNLFSTIASCYLFYVAALYKVPNWVYGRMVWHIALDYAIGLVPVLGIVGDFLYRANMKNWQLLEKFIDPDVLEGEIVDKE